MNAINETNVQRVLDYIKDFQRKEGRSPSFRQIAKGCGFSSPVVSQRYISILQKRGMVEKNSAGKIITPNNLSTGPMTLAPVVGSVACGNPIYAEENIEQTLLLPVAIFGSGELCGLYAKGNSMTGVGIFDGDLILYKPCNVAENGDRIVALIGNEATVKTYFKKRGYAILHPENPDYENIVTKELVIQGVVKHVIHSF